MILRHCSSLLFLHVSGKTTYSRSPSGDRKAKHSRTEKAEEINGDHDDGDAAGARDEKREAGDGQDADANQDADATTDAVDDAAEDSKAAVQSEDAAVDKVRLAGCGYISE